jgi:hypothetical protein
MEQAANAANRVARALGRSNKVPKPISQGARGRQ